MKAETELEQAQRITEDKKQLVHDELIRKKAIKEVSYTDKYQLYFVSFSKKKGTLFFLYCNFANIQMCSQ